MSNKKQDRLIGYTEASIFLIIWFVVFISPIVVQNEGDVLNWKSIFTYWTRLSPFLVLSTINHFLLVPFLFFRKKKVTYFLFVGFMLVISVVSISSYKEKKDWRNRKGVKNELKSRSMPNVNSTYRSSQFRDDKRISKGGNIRGRFNRSGALPPQLNLTIVLLLVIGFDTGLRTIFKWSQSEKKQTELEKEHLDTQLAFLRNQVSPHFFMNTLNNIHALIDIDTEEAKDAVIQLSKLMRHLLYDSEAEQIDLKKEIEFVRNFIDLMRLRYTDKVNIELNIQPKLPECRIPPLLFTSFLENAFKHGVSYQEDSFIHIDISLEKDNLKFSIKNSNPKNKKQDGPSGIGMVNTRKRLELLYQNNYSLEVLDDLNTFNVILILPV